VCGSTFFFFFFKGRILRGREIEEKDGEGESKIHHKHLCKCQNVPSVQLQHVNKSIKEKNT
jgi:hypothetical protein